MDFINHSKKKKNKNKFFMSDKSLWNLAQLGKPIYSDLLTGNLNKPDVPVFRGTFTYTNHQKYLVNFKSREDYMDNQSRGLAGWARGFARNTANNYWNNTWAGNNYAPPNQAPNRNDAYDMGHTNIHGVNVPNPDFYGYNQNRYLPPVAGPVPPGGGALAGAGYEAIPLRNRTNKEIRDEAARRGQYELVGFDNMPNNPVYRIMGG